MELRTDRKTILLAEADPECVERILSAVSRANFDCQMVTVHDGEAVIEFVFAAEQLAARGRARVPDLILLSRDLPKLDGIKVVKQLHWTHRDDLSLLPPIVMFSSRDDKREIQDAYRSGVASYLRMSPTGIRFVEEMQQVFLYWLYLNRVAPRCRCRPIAARYHGGDSGHFELTDIESAWFRTASCESLEKPLAGAETRPVRSSL